MDTGPSVREQIQYVRESARSNEYQKELSFLRHLMRYDETNERHALELKIARAQRSERCTRRAVGVMVVLFALAVAGLGYAALLLEDFPPNSTQFVTRIFCALGLASVVSLLAFAAFWLVARAELNEHRDACRRLVTKIIESRLGHPAALSAVEMPETVFAGSRRAVVNAEPRTEDGS